MAVIKDIDAAVNNFLRKYSGAPFLFKKARWDSEDAVLRLAGASGEYEDDELKSILETNPEAHGEYRDLQDTIFYQTRVKDIPKKEWRL